MALIIIGALMLIQGAANPLRVSLTHANKVGFIVFGLCALLIGAVSWILGGTSKIKGREGVVGVKVALDDLPWYGWVTDGGVLTLSIVLFVVLT
ncbi:MAG TPA: hypothetical protein VN253_24530 [Kofleriaceae bacterium]|nr:hypothetical protein [Kofleriaceae bacterium]